MNDPARSLTMFSKAILLPFNDAQSSKGKRVWTSCRQPFSEAIREFHVNIIIFGELSEFGSFMTPVKDVGADSY